MLGRTGDLAVPPTDDTQTPAPADEAGAGATRSLFDDFEALIDDGRTYFEAELSYQKNRAGFVANRLKLALVFGAVAAVLAVLAVFGLIVGLIIALTPLITAWGATAVVVLALLLAAFLLVRRAGRAFAELSAAMKPPVREEDSDV